MKKPNYVKLLSMNNEHSWQFTWRGDIFVYTTLAAATDALLNLVRNEYSLGDN